MHRRSSRPKCRSHNKEDTLAWRRAIHFRILHLFSTHRAFFCTRFVKRTCS